MRRDPKCFLWDIQQATHRIISLTAETTFDEYNADWKVSLLVERLFIIIGEATSRLQHHDQHIASQITNHRKIISLRNIIAHEYDDVRNDLIWTTIKNDLPTLLNEVNTLLKAE